MQSVEKIAIRKNGELLEGTFDNFIECIKNIPVSVFFCWTIPKEEGKGLLVTIGLNNCYYAMIKCNYQEGFDFINGKSEWKGIRRIGNEDGAGFGEPF